MRHQARISVLGVLLSVIGWPLLAVEVKSSFFEQDLRVIVGAATKHVQSIVPFCVPLEKAQIPSAIGKKYSHSQNALFRLSESCYMVARQSRFKKVIEAVKPGRLMCIEGDLCRFRLGRSRAGKIEFGYVLELKGFAPLVSFQALSEKAIFSPNDYAAFEVKKMTHFTCAKERQVSIETVFQGARRIAEQTQSALGLEGEGWVVLDQPGDICLYLPESARVEKTKLAQLPTGHKIHVFGRTVMGFDSKKEAPIPALVVDGIVFEPPSVSAKTPAVAGSGSAAGMAYTPILKRQLSHTIEAQVGNRFELQFIYRGVVALEKALLERILDKEFSAGGIALNARKNDFTLPKNTGGLIHVLAPKESKAIADTLHTAELGDTLLLRCRVSKVMDKDYLLLIEECVLPPVQEVAKK